MPEAHATFDGPLARITLSNPSARNAITRDMGDAVRGYIEEASLDPDVRAIVICGEGEHFCAGADLRQATALLLQTDGEIETYIQNHMHGVVSALWETPKPTLAVIRGACVGIGLSFAMACDLRVAASDAQLGLVFAKIGLHPDGGCSYLLPRLVGLGRAMKMMAFAETVDGAEAEQIGLVQQAVPAAELDTVAQEWATRLAMGPPVALRHIKGNLHFGVDSSLREALSREARTQVECLRSQDAGRGVAAFFAKTTPTFLGD